MRFSNDGVTFSGYQPYAATAVWTLSAGDGVKTVYAQFKDAEGNQSAVASDGITLALPDTTGPKVDQDEARQQGQERQGHHEGEGHRVARRCSPAR